MWLLKSIFSTPFRRPFLLGSAPNQFLLCLSRGAAGSAQRNSSSLSPSPPLPSAGTGSVQGKEGKSVQGKEEKSVQGKEGKAERQTEGGKRVGRREDVPSVITQFGTGLYQLSFVSHPGVMAVCKLLEMTRVSQHRAVLTQENINAIKEFDEELARKCQIAFDNSLDMNMMDIEHIDKPGYLEALRRDKEVLKTARKETFSLPVGGSYTQPVCLSDYRAPEVDVTWNPQNEVGAEVFEVQPGYRQEIELRGMVRSFINREKAKLGEGKERKAIGSSS